MKRLALFVAVLLAVAVVVPAAQAATTGNATVTLAANANAMIQILDPAVTLTPTPADYDVDFVEATGVAGLDVRVRSNSFTGMVLMVRCPDAAPQIALADLLIKTPTAAGPGGSTMAAYTAVSAVDQNLWSTAGLQVAWATVTTDIRIQNIFNYPDDAGGAATNYTNTLTYTVIAQ